ncbi:hypothetical protein [Micromonospora purpureochromogenes]|uniref:General stress protein CsbA n=1 Tax=Micromonospora purpureochromogenes TaxID=47872 RepID=A0ABX2RDC5_9ACTN|nr:hypothetical protein [Micromonospora purpureochromogenes]NYF54190.1 general stress protein CsbA [Micromonospora purpureochromogenes]
MSTFDEYAAAVRQLSVQVREGERGAAAEAERRRRLHAGVAQLGQRLAAQGQRLDQLGEAIGLPPATAAAPDGSDAGTGPPIATAAVDPDADSAADPGVVLEEARRLVDEADLRTREVEALAARPELLPTWSPAARAVAVYVACAAAGVLLMLVLVVASGVGLVSGFTLGAWICAGLPVLSFAAGWLILGRWGRPALAAVEPPRFVPLGFVICVALVPTAYCTSLLLVRFLR